MRIVKTWRGSPHIMNEDIKEMEDWNQSFGNGFATGLATLFIIATIMFFYGGCSYEGLDRNDKIVNPEEEEGADPNANFTASDWILFK